MVFRRIRFSTAMALALSGASGGALLAEESSSYTDPRDGQEYPVVDIDGMSWFASHLNYAAAGSYCYDNDEANCETYGRLYPWEISLSACPAGWHISSDAEWKMVETHLGMRYAELDTTNERGDDKGVGLRMLPGGDSGLNMVPGGWANPDLTFERGGEQAALWNANEADPGHAWHRDVGGVKTGVWRSRVFKPYALSVRCVKDRLTPDTIGEWHKIEE